MNIVIAGAGPRGLSVLERITARASQTPDKKIRIHLFDPFGPGGKVWREDQPLNLLINSVADQVTLFTDETLSTGGPVKKGPSLYEWAKRNAAVFIRENISCNQAFFLQEAGALGPKDCCSRAFYGLYQKWYYQHILQTLPENIAVTFSCQMVQEIKKQDRHFSIRTQEEKFSADIVIMALGHHETALSKEEAKLKKTADQHHLFYSPPQNAADASFPVIPPKENLLLRGLGLSFFDYLAMIIAKHGGSFQRKSGKLIYIPSGKEPRIIAGSGKGLPYHPRGKNQEAYGEKHQPVFLTDAKLQGWKKAGQAPAKEFYTLMQKEMELVYYTLLLQEKYPAVSTDAFANDFISQKGREKVLTQYGISEARRFDWKSIEQPFSRKKADQSFPEFLLDFLKRTYAEGLRGSNTGPLTAAFECLKDMRDQVRFMLDHSLFTADEQVKWQWQWLAPLNKFLTIGPPLSRTEELIALMEAGIVTILPPGMKVETRHGHFFAYSEAEPETACTASFFYEARLQSTQVSRTINPLLRQLQTDCIAHSRKLTLSSGENFCTGAIAVDPFTNEVLDAKGEIIPGLFCYAFRQKASTG